MRVNSENDTRLPAGATPSPYVPSGWVRVAFWICIVISVVVVLRRVSAIVLPPRNVPPQVAGLDAVFASHTALTLAHIVPALAFVVIAPWVILRPVPKLAWPERLLFLLGAIVGLTAYAMSVRLIGGWIERSAVLFFNTLFLYSLARAYQYSVQGTWRLERRWMVRGVVILLGIATTRPVMGVFFATSRLTHWTPSQFFGVAFWIGFSINTIGVELWLRAQDRRSRSQEALLQSAR